MSRNHSTSKELQKKNYNLPGLPIVRHTIADLIPTNSSVHLVGVIIAKDDIRSITPKNEGGAKNVVSFILRDSFRDFISVSVWGKGPFIEETRNFHVGDVVELINAIVSCKPCNGSDEKFRPWTPGMYTLMLTDHRSSISHYEGHEISNFKELLRIPTKPANDYYTIADVLANTQRINGKFINMMVAVRKIFPVKTFKTKTGKLVYKTEIDVYDQTKIGFSIMVWGETLCKYAEAWHENIIYFADIRVSNDQYHHQMIGHTNSKTIATLNPDSNEAVTLYHYAASLDKDQIQGICSEASGRVDISSIKDVYTVNKVIAQMAKGCENLPIFGVIYGCLSSFDLDNCNPKSFIKKRCRSCRKLIDSKICEDCSKRGEKSENCEGKLEYMMKVDLADHTGSFSSINVGSNVLQNMLDTSPEQFLRLTPKDATNLKWKHLLRQKKLFFKITPSKENTPALRLMDCQDVVMREIIRHCKDML